MKQIWSFSSNKNSGKKIRYKEYEFIFANNGRHTLEQLVMHDDVNIVLSDINMPKMV